LQNIGPDSLVVFKTFYQRNVDTVEIRTSVCRPLLVKGINNLDAATASGLNDDWVMVPGKEGKAQSNRLLLANSSFQSGTELRANTAVVFLP
jgi:hypothetical protein